MTPDSLEPLAISVIFVTLIVSVAGVLRHALRVRQQRVLADLRLQMQNRVLDRLERPEQLLEHLGSEEGRRWLELDDGQPQGAAGRILGSLQVGAVAVLVGMTLFFLQGSFEDREVSQALMLIGAVGAAAGLGFLASAVAALLLGRRWGLLPEGDRSRVRTGGGE